MILGSIVASTALSNDKTIIPTFGRSLLLPATHPLCGSQTVFAHLKKYFRSSAMQRFFEKNWKQNKLIQLDGLIISSLLNTHYLSFQICQNLMVLQIYLLILMTIAFDSHSYQFLVRAYFRLASQWMDCGVKWDWVSLGTSHLLG